jgi:hypothetical protein
MHPEITRMLMNERVADQRRTAAEWRRAIRVRRHRRLSLRHPRPRVAWAG